MQGIYSTLEAPHGMNSYSDPIPKWFHPLLFSLEDRTFQFSYYSFYVLKGNTAGAGRLVTSAWSPKVKVHALDKIHCEDGSCLGP